MSKSSNKKKSKAKKKSSNKRNQDKSTQTSNAQKSSKAVDSKKSSKKPEASKNKDSTEEYKDTRTLKQMLAFVAGFLVLLMLGVAYVQSSESKREVQSSADPSPRQGQQTIKVEPSAGNPTAPSGQSLQGSKPSGQQAQGGLQRPQTVDQLQPNARIDDYENANLE